MAREINELIVQNIIQETEYYQSLRDNDEEIEDSYEVFLAMLRDVELLLEYLGYDVLKEEKPNAD